MEFNSDLVLNIAIVVGVVGAVAALYFGNKKKKAFEVISYLVDYAENQFGSGNGEYKYNYVIDYEYNKGNDIKNLIYYEYCLYNIILDKVIEAGEIKWVRSL